MHEPGTPKVSVITIFLDEERFLAEAVESVLAQTYPHWELLLCDDGSSDGSTAVARAYASRHPGRIYYLEHEGHANRGMSATRNLGIAAARGEFVAFLDGDDVYEPEKLERQVAVLEQNPDVAIVCGPNLLWYGWSGDPAEVARDYQTRIGVRPGNIEGRELLSAILSGHADPPGTCSVLVRRDALLGVGGFEDEFRGMFEDQVFLAKILLDHDAYVLRESLDRYRQHDDSACFRAIAASEHHLDLPGSARTRYLRWLDAYLSARAGSAKLRQLVRRELWFSTRPAFARLRLARREWVGRTVARASAIGLVLGRGLLPQGLRHRLWDLHVGSASARLTPARVKPVDIEVGRPIEDLTGLAGYGAVQGLVRAHGVPVGFIHVPVERGGCTRRAIENAVSRQLEEELVAHLREGEPTGSPAGKRSVPFHDRFRAPEPWPDAPWPALTVAVCTRDRPADLARCVDALVRLDYPDLDIVVIDNAPSDDATERILRDGHPMVRYLREPRPGLDWARNRAILEARGEIIAFTDDDVVVEPDWARALAAAFFHGDDVAAAAGLVVPLELETAAQIQFERYGGFMPWFTRKKLRGEAEWGVRGAWHYCQMSQYFSGASMAFRRRAFETIGLFDPALDVGTPTNAGGDTDMFFRVLKEGHAILYEPRAIARHGHRREYAQLQRQIHGWGTGYYAFLTRNALAYPEAAWVLALFGLRGFGLQAARLAGALVRFPGFPRALLWAELRGAVAGPLLYARARRRAAAIARSFGPVPAPEVAPADLPA